MNTQTQPSHDWQQAAAIFAREVCVLCILVQPKVLQGLVNACDEAVERGDFEGFITGIARLQNVLEPIIQSLAGQQLDTRLASELERALSAGGVDAELRE